MRLERGVLVGFRLLAKSVEGANGMTVAFIFVPYLSSAFVPTASMPASLRAFAENQPVTHVVEALRALTIGTPMGNHGWLWCGAWRSRRWRRQLPCGCFGAKQRAEAAGEPAGSRLLRRKHRNGLPRAAPHR